MSEDQRNYDLTGAHIQIAMLFENALYDDSFYSKSITGYTAYSEILLSKQEDFTKLEMILHEADIVGSSRSLNDIKFYYISDIHLNHK